eukprot:6036872-Amphidinium_carterae.2
MVQTNRTYGRCKIAKGAPQEGQGVRGARGVHTTRVEGSDQRRARLTTKDSTVPKRYTHNTSTQTNCTLPRRQLSRGTALSYLSDIASAFLNVPVQQGMTILVQLSPERENDDNTLWLLKKQLYSLRSSPQKFPQQLSIRLQQLGLAQL